MSRLTKLAPQSGQTDFMLVCAKASLAEAREKHPHPFVDYSHMMGVLDEEIFEVRMETHRKRVRVEAIQTELLQVIAVCLRGLEDLTLKPFPRSKPNLVSKSNGNGRVRARGRDRGELSTSNQRDAGPKQKTNKGKS